MSGSGLEILMAHLVGDYLLQNDWMAKHKALPYPGPEPVRPEPDPKLKDCESKAQKNAQENIGRVHDAIHRAKMRVWSEKVRLHHAGNRACWVHCLIYTLTVWAFCRAWIGPVGLGVCFASHFVIDRYALAYKWLTRPNRWYWLGTQEGFAACPCYPWSIIVVDNIWHLLTLYFLWLALA